MESNEGRTALVVAHRLSTIQRMDTIIVMDGGTIIESGTREELIEGPTAFMLAYGAPERRLH